MGRLEPDSIAYPTETYPCPATEFRCGDVLLEILDDRSDDDVHGGVSVYNFGVGDGMSLADAERKMQALAAILSDPRAQALLGHAPAVRIEPHICDDEMDPRCGKEVNWTDYCAGNGDDQI